MLKKLKMFYAIACWSCDFLGHTKELPVHYFSPIIVILFISGVHHRHHLSLNAPFDAIEGSVNCWVIGKETVSSGCFMQNDVSSPNWWKVLSLYCLCMHCQHRSERSNSNWRMVKDWWIAMMAMLGLEKPTWFKHFQKFSIAVGLNNVFVSC